jgi:mRNA interferase HicA
LQADTFLCQLSAVTGHEFIRRVRRLGRLTGTAVEFVAEHGKGSHGRLYYGERFTTVKDRKKELRKGLGARMPRDLGLTPRGLDRGT